MIHGKAGTYTNHGCRCDACREANNRAFREWTHRTGRRRPMDVYLAERYAEPPAHGTESRYSSGCRCDECRAASAAARRARRYANLEATRTYDREYKRRYKAAQS